MKSIIIHQPPSTNQRKQTRKENPFQTRIQESSYDNSSSTDNELSDLTTSYNSFPSNIHPTDCSPNFIRDTTLTNLSVSNPSTGHSTNSKPSSQPSPLIHCTTSLTSRFPNETALEDEINTRLLFQPQTNRINNIYKNQTKDLTTFRRIPNPIHPKKFSRDVGSPELFPFDIRC